MAAVILAGDGAEESAVPLLQRAGFSGREIAAHIDEADRLVTRALLPTITPQANAPLCRLAEVLAASVALALQVECGARTSKCSTAERLEGAANG
jgi:hypothetical protein